MASIGLVQTLLLLGALLVLAGILSSLVATRFGTPVLLVFLVLGMLAGEDGPGGLMFDDYRLTYLIGSAALAIILFDGGLRTRLATFRGALAPAAVLATAGVLITAALAGFLATRLLSLSPLEGLVLGAIVASTDAAAVFFVLRASGLQLKQRVHSTLEIESGTNDPLAVFLTVVLVELILAGQGDPTWSILGALGRQIGVGAAVGLFAGFAICGFLNKAALPGGLHPLFVVAGAVLVYAAASVAGGSGFLAVYLAGLVVGNRPVRAFASILSFHSTATWLCQIVMFLLLGLLVTPSKLVDYVLPALGIAAFLMLVARPAAVWLCLWPFKFTVQERLFVSWVGLRGAVSIFLAAIPVLSGVARADVYFNVAFVVVLASLVIQGWTVNPVARRLGLALPRAAPSVRRVELDLPGQLEHELVGYPILTESPILSGGNLPSWARPVLVIREAGILDIHEAGALRQGDFAYFLAPSRRVRHLDRLFAALAETPAGTPAPLGQFVFRGDVKIARLAEIYDLGLDPDESGLTLAELFEKRFDTRPEIGDRLVLGNAALVVRELDGERVSRVGLQIAGEAPPPAPGAPAAFWQAWLESLAGTAKRLLGRKSHG